MTKEEDNQIVAISLDVIGEDLWVFVNDKEIWRGVWWQAWNRVKNLIAEHRGHSDRVVVLTVTIKPLTKPEDPATLKGNYTKEG